MSNNEKEDDKTKSKKDLLKISEVARNAGVSISTVKHYVNEGLISYAMKTGRNMAYYDPSCIETVIRIKELQRKKYLPLPVIKRLLTSGAVDNSQLALGDAIHRTRKLDLPARKVPESSVEKKTGYSKEKIQTLRTMGILNPEYNKGVPVYDEVDLRIIDIARERERLGLPFEYNKAVLGAYAAHLEEAVSEDIRLFTNMILTETSPEMARTLIDDVDEYLDQFITIYRLKLSRIRSEEAIQDMNILMDMLPELFLVDLDLKKLPDFIPEGVTPIEEFFFHFLRKDFACALQVISTADLAESTAWCLQILIHLFSSGKESFPELENSELPSDGTLCSDTVAAIILLVRLKRASGFIKPLMIARELINRLSNTDCTSSTAGGIGFFYRMVQGLTYTMLPVLFGFRERGLGILTELAFLEEEEIRGMNLPAWYGPSFRHEILPALQTRIDRVIISGSLSHGEVHRAADYLAKLKTTLGENHPRYREALHILESHPDYRTTLRANR